MNTLVKLDAAISFVLRGLMALGLAVVLVGLIFQMLSRYVLGSALFGIEEIVTISAFWAFFLGLSYGARKQNLISGEIMTSFTSDPTILHGVDIAARLLSLISAGIFCLWSIEMVEWTATSGGKTPIFGFSLLVYQLPVLFGFAMCVIYFVMQLVQLILSPIRYKPLVSDETELPQ